MSRSVACAPSPLDLVVMADRRDDVAAEGVRERIDERRESQRPIDLGSGYDRMGDTWRNQRAEGTVEVEHARGAPCGHAADRFPSRRYRTSRTVRRALRCLPCASHAATPPITTPTMTAAKITAKSGTAARIPARPARTDRATGSPLPVGDGEQHDQDSDGRSTSAFRKRITRHLFSLLRAAAFRRYFGGRHVEPLPHFLAGLEDRDDLLEIDTISPVRGLRPVRASRFFTENAPKPRSSTRSPSPGHRDVIEDGVDDVFDVALVQMRVLFGELEHQFGFDHVTAISLTLLYFSEGCQTREQTVKLEPRSRPPLPGEMPLRRRRSSEQVGARRPRENSEKSPSPRGFQSRIGKSLSNALLALPAKPPHRAPTPIASTSFMGNALMAAENRGRGRRLRVRFPTCRGARHERLNQS